jgi:hypothetical protein
LFLVDEVTVEVDQMVAVVMVVMGVEEGVDGIVAAVVEGLTPEAEVVVVSVAAVMEEVLVGLRAVASQVVRLVAVGSPGRTATWEKLWVFEACWE